MAKNEPPRDEQRIAKLLARAGVASRREIERMIAEGRVALHGNLVETPATLLPSLAGVTVDGNPVAEPEAARLFLYHKPVGLLVTERDPGGRPTIYDRLPSGRPRLLPVGRLDLNTEGLLLLTTDGELKRQLELPATGVERAYRARAYGPVTQAQLEDLIHGVEIDGIRYGSIDANLERRTGTNVWIEVVLKEGKNREVRRVLEHLGLKVSRLLRTRYGPFVLGDLPVGAVAEVRPHDVDSFRKNPTRLDLPQPARRASPSIRAEAPAESEPVRRPAPRPQRFAAPVSPKAPSQGSAAAGRQPARGDRATDRPSRTAAGERPARAAASRPVGADAPSGKPNGRKAKGPRTRADGTVAVREGSAREKRARTFRDAGEPRTVRPTGAKPKRPPRRPK
ncbi:pseudouridine synthase [Sphingomonas aracearum]|uniref:pseudouridine synthase n=1 Tax=Sphingomonas aracearum TaxID=2283317 RepID=UPI001EEFCBC5|nr:pseudouridine synthase [Sphingomonas aracearum]